MRRFTALFLALLLLCSLFVTAQAASPYYIEVDLTAQIVTVYRNDNRTPSGIVRQMACSSGVNKRTPTGTFSISTRASTDRKEWYWLSEYQCYVQYATRITGHILFHSLPTVGKDKNTLDATAVAKFGSPASHGCIRLRTEDAAWIARNIPDSTICRMFYGKKNNDVLSALMESCYSAEDGLTYEEFLGYSDDPNVISRNSDAETVRALQAELQSLGYYGGALDGVFSPALRVAIRAAQSAVGLRTSGLGEATLIDAIDNDEIPLSTRATLGSGMSGRAVERLQNALSVIGFYTGDNDGVYSDALAEAVRNYGLVYGLPTAADTNLQNAVISAADVFVYPYSDTFSVNIITDRHGQMRAKSATYLYSRQSTSGKKIVRVPKKAYVEVLSRNGSWSYCRYGNAYGWMKNSKGTYSTYVTYRAEYVSPDNIALQERLASLGYYTGSVNGVYDDLTLDAVAAWQADNGYAVDGVIADDSRTAINTEGATTSTRRRLDIGSEGESVKVLQQSLLTLGYYNGEIDGIYSDALAEAVLNYGRVQRINTVADTTLQDSAINNADTFTFPYGATYTLNLRAVSHAYMRATRNTYLYSKQSTGGSRIIRVPKGATVEVTARNSSWSYCIYKGRGGWMRNKYGSYSTTTEYFADYSCPETEALQQRLVSLGYFTGSVNGIYNAETIEAVAAWQNDNGQEATGEVTDDERLSIDSESATTSTRRQLTVGSEGESVKVLQRSLQALGYYDGEIDGIYSEALGSAVRLFSLVRSSGDRIDADAGLQQLVIDTADTFERPENSRLEITETQYHKGTVNRTSAYVYNRASTSGTRLGTVRKGNTFDVLERGSTWTRISFNGGIGYIKTAYLNFSRYSVFTEAYIVDEPELLPEETDMPEALEEVTEEPIEEPTVEPSNAPTVDPSEEPTSEPSEEPAIEPSEEPTAEPSEDPTAAPDEEATVEPSEEPTAEPSEAPSEEPEAEPTAAPASEASTVPTDAPTLEE